MMWYIAIAIGIAQVFAVLVGAAALRAAGRADRWLESPGPQGPSV